VDDTIIINVRALEPGEGVVAAWVRMRQGKIAELGPADRMPRDTSELIDGGGWLLTPGLIDIHTHGIEQFAYESGPEQIVAAARRLGQYGTTCVLPTLYRVMSPERLGELERLAAALPQCEYACMPGFHLEGPFLALPGAGAQTLSGDLGLLEELLAAAGGKVRAVSISPDTPNVLPVIERLCELGIVPFMTHTRATVEQTVAAIQAGAKHATHFYDVFYLPDSPEAGIRPVGAVEAILADSRCTVDFVADGVHVHPMAVRAALAAKGFRNIMTATDSNVGAGLPPGIYDSPVGGQVRVSSAGGARLHQPGSPDHGGLAGSTLTLDCGIGNLLSWLDLPEEQVWAMGSSNPARLLGLSTKGTLRVGADADLVLWDQTAGQLRAVRTWVGGRCIYERPTST
jgi:N-acetylglucosamine-6-phosphate deacetylase